jgi:hypothetical protein
MNGYAAWWKACGYAGWFEHHVTMVVQAMGFGCSAPNHPIRNQIRAGMQHVARARGLLR